MLEETKRAVETALGLGRISWVFWGEEEKEENEDEEEEGGCDDGAAVSV